MLICLNNLPGVGETCEQATPITTITGLFLTAPDFDFDTFASFATQSDWVAAIAAGQVFPVQNIIEDESQNVEAAIYDSPIGKKAFMRSSINGHAFKVMLPLEQHKAFIQYSLKNWRVFYLDANNNLRGTTDGTKVKGFKLSFCYVGDQMISTDQPPYSPVIVQEANSKEWNQNGIYVNPTWLGTDLPGILTVFATSGAVAANSCTVVVAYEDDSELSSAGVKKTIPVSGLIAANFQMLHGITAITAGKTITETAVLGTYTVAATSLVATDTIQVIPGTDTLYRSNVVTLSA